MTIPLVARRGGFAAFSTPSPVISLVQSTGSFTEVDTEHWTIELTGVQATSGLLLHTNIYGNGAQPTVTVSDSNGGTWASVWLAHWYANDCHQLWECINPTAGSHTLTVTSTVARLTAGGGDAGFAEVSMWEFANLGAPSSSPAFSPSGPTSGGVLSPSPSPGLTFTATTTSTSATLSSVSNVLRAPIGATITGTGIPSSTTIVSVNVGASTLVMSNAATASGSITVTPVSTETILMPTVTPASVGDLVFMFGWGGQHLQYVGDALTNVNQDTPPFTDGNVLEPGAGGNPITPPWTNIDMGLWGGGDTNQNPLPDAFAWQVVGNTSPVTGRWTMFTSDGWFSQGISFAAR